MSSLAASSCPARLRAERERRVRDAVSRLPKQYRAVIEGLFVEDPPVPYQVMAQRLGVPPAAVNFLRARGLRKLARILGEFDSSRGPYGLRAIDPVARRPAQRPTYH